MQVVDPWFEVPTRAVRLGSTACEVERRPDGALSDGLALGANEAANTLRERCDVDATADVLEVRESNRFEVLVHAGT